MSIKSQERKSDKTGHRRAPRRITARYLHNAALAWVQRFAGNSASLRSLLMRKVARAAAHHGDDPQEGEKLVEAVIADFTERGLLDDAAWAIGMVRSLSARGDGERKIRGRLMQKGLDMDAIDHALERFRHEREESAAVTELAAAIRLAERRRIGPFRREGRAKRAEDDTKRWRRETGALARAGFSADIARKIIGADSTAALEDMLEDLRSNQPFMPDD